jgi:exopolysaccharide biosynthesis protein
MVTAPLKDQWVGILTNRDPRTAVGIKEDGKILLVTVDGRQPGYSYGLTAEELAELLIELGAKDAAMLDGGASTQMIIEGKTINRPSFRGEGRPLAGGLIVQIPVSDHGKAEKR